MGFISSKILIQAHAFLLTVLAVHLMRSPEVITESDVVLMLGELLQLDAPSSFSLSQPHYALCGILLIIDALIDLVLVYTIPQINEVFAMAEAARSHAPGSVAGAMRANPFMARLGSLYSEIWTLLSAARFCVFFAVSFYIFQCQPSVWAGIESVGNVSTVAQLKSPVTFTFGFMEMMFWLWISVTIREEKQAVSSRFLERGQ
ncbi:uncharacterized protein BP01DRAFT_294172 [Aspergillus saccharolyticus JOP 1030-1]|uniref:Increased loss of mitochondrial DNA protein 1 n=1 Tax=Aspergillus saccharolyticus JOP 1030-1 TaxID=1450539 RepID=A0A318ZNQ6_9EURO|nr:hypothetical protein BP01DRAFT_294172 [Aspergillus saccharolyticus JOP 1030-1]PYH46083.1 hypothetical protein BP01DRAFT_294172 [Aspergillus saccharolyticus JOP 1030-1]